MPSSSHREEHNKVTIPGSQRAPLSHLNQLSLHPQHTGLHSGFGLQLVTAEHKPLPGLNPALERCRQAKQSRAVSGRVHFSLPMIWTNVQNVCLPHHPVNQTSLGVSFDFFLVCQNKPQKQTVEFVSSTHIELTSALFGTKSRSIWRYNSKPSGLSLAIRCCAHYTCYKEKG